jgi:hypothetical protein
MNKPSYYPNGGKTTFELAGESDARPLARGTSGIMRWLALGATIGPVLFTLAWLVLGFLSPGFTIFGTLIAPYSPISAGISGLGLGVTAPWMNAAFILNGLLIIAGSIGIFQNIPDMSRSARWICTLLIALTGLGSLIDGVFTLESFMPHMLGFLLAILSTVVSFLIIGLLLRRLPRWHRFGSWLILGSPLTLALTVLYFLTFTPTVAGARSGIAGLTERILVTEVLAWIACLGWLAFRRSSAGD